MFSFLLMIFSQSPPHLALQKFIGQYLYFYFNTTILPSLKQIILPYDIPAVSFFIGLLFLIAKKAIPQALIQFRILLPLTVIMPD